MILVDAVLLGLATWRIANMVVAPEDGPFDIFPKLRKLFGIKYDEYSEPYSNNVIGKAMLCMWCFTVWVGIVITIIYFLAPNVAIAIAFPFVLSTIALWFDNMIK